MSDYEWSLIKQDIIDYGMDNINGKKDFYYDSFGGYTISYPYPVKLIYNESCEYAELDADADYYYYGFEYSTINSAESKNQLYDIAIEVQNESHEIYNAAIENYYFMIESTGYWIEQDCTIEFNIGLADNGRVWFLT